MKAKIIPTKNWGKSIYCWVYEVEESRSTEWLVPTPILYWLPIWAKKISQLQNLFNKFCISKIFLNYSKIVLNFTKSDEFSWLSDADTDMSYRYRYRYRYASGQIEVLELKFHYLFS